jgi:hypothetical protein
METKYEPVNGIVAVQVNPRLRSVKMTTEDWIALYMQH